MCKMGVPQRIPRSWEFRQRLIRTDLYLLRWLPRVLRWLTARLKKLKHRTTKCNREPSKVIKLADELLQFLLSVQHHQHYLITVVPGLHYDIIVLGTKFLQTYHQSRSMIFSSHHDVLLNLENV